MAKRQAPRKPKPATKIPACENSFIRELRQAGTMQLEPRMDADKHGFGMRFQDCLYLSTWNHRTVGRMSIEKPGLLCRHIRVYQCSSVVLFCMDTAKKRGCFHEIGVIRGFPRMPPVDWRLDFAPAIGILCA
jgi:hypothetical protein